MIRLALALSAFAGAATAQGLVLPDGAELVEEVTAETGRLSLPLGPWAGGEAPRDIRSGPVTRQVWELPATDTGAVAALIETGARAAGYEVLFACASRLCGGYDFRMALEVAPPPAMFVDLADYRYLALAKGEERAFALISRSGGRGFVQLSRVGGAAPPPPAGPAATVPATGESVEAALERRGRTILPGLRFATGSADLAEGPVEALDALAAYLARHPDRRIGLVGHTDASGSLEANIALSRRRATAVLERLVADHGVARDRMEAQGMGYLSPLATNLTPEGRESNRRVEAILLSTE